MPQAATARTPQSKVKLVVLVESKTCHCRIILNVLAKAKMFTLSVEVFILSRGSRRVKLRTKLRTSKYFFQESSRVRY